MRARSLFALVTVVVACAAGSFASAAGTQEMGTLPLSPPAFDYAARQVVIDRVLAESSDIPAAWKEVSGLLEPIHADVIATGTGAPLDFLTNPEPSSVLVWGALFAGVVASGYAYRRRGMEFMPA